MEHPEHDAPRPPRTRRKKRSPMQIFIHSYLPPVAIALVLILFIIFAVGSVRRGNEKREAQRQESIAQEQSLQQLQLDWENEAASLIAQAQKKADSCLFEEAIAILDTFSGNPDDFPDLVSCRTAWENGDASLVLWEDVTKIPHLSFNMLVADSARAFSAKGGYRESHVTTGEFSAILTQLHQNGYMLVKLTDIFTTVVDAEGNTVVQAKALYLPEGKKPLLLTQTQGNYYTKMVDGDKDGLADKDGFGFASRLLVNENGALTCEIVTANGQVNQGDFDLIPILEKFIAEHPDFSYKGARATLAVTGYDGIFGYRINPEAAENLGQEVYEQQLAALPPVISALKEKGYLFACNTYGNLAYGKLNIMEMKQDLLNWQTVVTPVLGETDILVYTRSSDIDDTKDAYHGAKHTALQEAGFHYFMGFCYNSNPWMNISQTSIRQGRLMVTGDNLKNRESLFAQLFDAKAVMNPG